MSDRKKIEAHFNALIAGDKRPQHLKDRYQFAHGAKLTNIESVRVIQAPQGAGAAPPIKQQTQTTIANAGNTTTGVLPSGPINPAAVNQNILSDCWLLVAILIILFARPDFFDDIIVPIGNGKVVVQFYVNGMIVQITTSLVVSTDYDKPTNGDIRVELLEKCSAFVRYGISDYYQLNFGFVGTALSWWGLDIGGPSVLNAAAIMAAIQAGKVCAVSTNPHAFYPWIQNHDYGVRGSVVIAGTTYIILRNPWAGAMDMQPTDPAVFSNPDIINGIIWGAFPASKRIQASYVNVPTPPPSVQGVTMTSIASLFLSIFSAVLTDAKTETQGGIPDVGYWTTSPGTTITFANFSIPSAGAWNGSFLWSSQVAGSLQILVDGVAVGTVAVPSTGGWSTFVSVGFRLGNLTAGSHTIEIIPQLDAAGKNETQGNLGVGIFLTPVQ